MTVATSHESRSSTERVQGTRASFIGYPASGAARATTTAWFEVAAIGNRGYDGVLIDWKRARAWSLGLGDLEQRLEQNGVLELVSSGCAAQLPERPLSTITLKRIGRTFHVVYDFGPIGAKSVAVEVRCKGRTVSYRRGVTDTSAVIDGLGGPFSPRVSHDLTGNSRQGQLAAAVSWSRPAAVRVADGEAWNGDELIVYPEHAAIGAGVRFLGTVCLQAAPAGYLNAIEQSRQRVSPGAPVPARP